MFSWQIVAAILRSLPGEKAEKAEKSAEKVEKEKAAFLHAAEFSLVSLE